MLVKCKECGKEFELTAEEVKWYNEKGFELPKRCKSCRVARKEKRYNGTRN